MLKGTKAETLYRLKEKGFNVPDLIYFEVAEWRINREKILVQIQEEFTDKKVAIRSSGIAEDTADNSLAGAFDSVLNVDCNKKKSIKNAVEKVISSFDIDDKNQVLVQEMVENVAISGVAFTKVLDDGSPYYVINFDDTTGKTDSVTSGKSINKTVYIYNGVKEKDFDSPYLLLVLKLIWQLENCYKNTPMDIEFAVTKNNEVHLLQVRRITTINKWNIDANKIVSERIEYLAEYITEISKKRPKIFGKKTLFGLMPDWNPAEMIGVVPHPLALSLYRTLITKKVWSDARAQMGYYSLPNIELMVSLFGRTYIDVRNSFNSFLPNGLPDSLAEKIINAAILKLENEPHLHDKIEFEVIFTAYDFNFKTKFFQRYPDLLSKYEFLLYESKLKEITINNLSLKYNSSLKQSLKKIEHLKTLQKQSLLIEGLDKFSLADYINILIGECINYGTLPFSIIARHAFIAENLLRSLVEVEKIKPERIREFKKSFKTISGEMSEDLYKVKTEKLSEKMFMEKYGHLRPSSYDILSSSYRDRKELFGEQAHKPKAIKPFNLSEEEIKTINTTLLEHNFINIDAKLLFDYAKEVIIGREYAKFVFTKHLSLILDCIAQWGVDQGIRKDDLSMLRIDEITNVLFSPLTNVDRKFFQERINKSRIKYSIASSFKLSYLIRSIRDIFVVPQQRSAPNFIGDKRVEKNIFLLTPYIENTPDLSDKIICIEGADPGYDWIFTRNIAGLITKYGGANSHMAIRCAEYGLPAAIGCGEQTFERVVSHKKCVIDCQRKILKPVDF